MNLVGVTIDRLKARRWDNIREKWLHHIPLFDQAGCAPENSLDQLPGFGTISNLLSEKATAEANKGRSTERITGYLPLQAIIEESELVGLREAIFWDSLFLLHKARHVIGTAETQACQGMRTWALANAYQGAFFAAKAVLGFLGVALPEWNNKGVAVDLFPYAVTRGDQYSTCMFYYLGTRLDHKNVWEIFQRILAVSTVQLWPKIIVNKLKSIDTKHFAKQRNFIHYRNNGWIYPDMHEPDLTGSFGDPIVWQKGLDFDQDDISMVVGLAILKLGLILIQDIERFSAKLTPELRLLATSVQKGLHPLYGELLLASP